MRRMWRYQNLFRIIDFDRLPDGAGQEPVTLDAADNALSRAILYTPRSSAPKTVVCFMHPKADMSRHYAVPFLLDSGYAVFCQNSRSPNNDTATMHEPLLLDVAAGQRFLRDRGFERVVLVGNSGGGSLFSFYQAQAVREAGARLSETVTGDPVDLSGAMAPADGIVFLAAHLGEGKYLLDALDPSVIDETKPLEVEPSLDLFDPANGFVEPPASSSYSAEFLERYRAAQRERVARLDAAAREMIEERRRARDLRTRALGRLMVIYRTEAEPRQVDLSIDPSERDVGTLLSVRPDIANYLEIGFARVVNPRAWLSTWSGLSSHADTCANAREIDAPALVISYTGDNAVFPSAAAAIHDALRSSDKQRLDARGDHFGFPLPGAKRSGREQALTNLTAWLDERFGA
jgi:hypothetical protein